MFANIHQIVKIWTLQYFIFADINIPLLCLKLELYVGQFLTFIYLFAVEFLETKRYATAHCIWQNNSVHNA